MRLAIAFKRSFVTAWLALTPPAPKLVFATEVEAPAPPTEARLPAPKPGALAEPRAGREATGLEIEAKAKLDVKPEGASGPGRPCADESSCPGVFFIGEIVGTTFEPPLCEVSGAAVDLVMSGL